jgi:pantoate kinase
MSNYHCKYRSESGQTRTSIFIDNPTLEEAMKECQDMANRRGVRVTLCETRFVETTVQQFDPIKEGESE